MGLPDGRRSRSVRSSRRHSSLVLIVSTAGCATVLLLSSLAFNFEPISGLQSGMYGSEPRANFPVSRGDQARLLVLAPKALSSGRAVPGVDGGQPSGISHVLGWINTTYYTPVGMLDYLYFDPSNGYLYGLGGWNGSQSFNSVCHSAGCWGNGSSNFVIVLDPATGKVVSALPVAGNNGWAIGSPIAYDSLSGNLLVLAGYGRACPSCAFSNVVQISPSDNVSTLLSGLGSDADAITYDPNNNELYVNNYIDLENASVLAFNATTGAAIATIPVFSDYGLAAVPSEGRIYVAESTSGDGGEVRNLTLVVINDTTNTVVATFPDADGNLTPFWGAQASGIWYDPVNGDLYLDSYYNTVLVFDTANSTVVATLNELPQQPFPVAIDSQDGQIYIDNWGAADTYSWTITGVDGATNGIDQTLALGDNASDALAFDPATGFIYPSVAINVSSPRFNQTAIAVLDPGPEPLTLNVTPPSDDIDLGQWANFSVSVGAGNGPTSYSWSGLPGCPTSTSDTLSCRPNETGTFEETVTATDAYGVSNSVGASIVVRPPVSIAAITSSSEEVDDGQPVTFTATATGGTGIGSYSWSGIPSGLQCDGTTAGATLNCTAEEPGNWTVSVAWTDSNGEHTPVTPSPMVRVNPSPLVVRIVTNRSSVDVGGRIGFVAATTGGSGGGLYAWSAPEAELLCGTSIGPTLNCTAWHVGTANVSVAWTDSLGETSPTFVVPFTVDPGPTLVGIEMSTGLPSIDVGQSIVYTANVSGGSGGGTYLWGGNLTVLGCAPTDGPILDCTPTVPSGLQTVEVRWTDSSGAMTGWATSSPVIVNPDPTVKGVTLRPASGSVTVGGSIAFTAEVTGGSGGGTYAWSGIPTGLSCNSTLGPTLSCTANTIGTDYRVNVSWTDSNGISSPTYTSAPISVVQPSVGASSGVPTTLFAIGTGAILVAVLAVAWILRRRTKGPAPPESVEPYPGEPLESPTESR